MSARSFATSVDTSTSQLPFVPSLAHLDSNRAQDGFKTTTNSSGIGYTVFDRPIDKSPSDDRLYRLIRLKNGLEALLISDPTADKAAAALSVRVGNLSDPEELQGLAHFCEHLLFMGTKKYPRENDYNEYLSSNSGSSNAFTGMEQTTYFFDVHPEALDGALDRFSQFFIAPLFDASCTEREIQAVDSENKKNLQSDMWRLYQLEKSLSSRQHAYWRFGTGNMDTLWNQPRKQGLDVREELLKFHKKHYSANLMKLALIGKQSLDELTAMVVERLSAAENQNLAAPEWPSSPYTAEELKTLTLAKTVKDHRSLELSFPIPDQDPLFATKPGRYLSHFIGHEGEGSILSFLKQKGWANQLGAGPSGGATGFDFFKVSLDLTKQGLENYEAVAQTVFKYIELLKSTPPQEWAFKEVQMLGEINFRFQDKEKPSNYVTHLVSELHKPYPRSWLLSAPYLWQSFDRDQIAGAISQLSINNCRVTVASQQPLPGFTYDKKEKWYGTQYTIQPMPSSLLEVSPEAEAGLALPEPNSFLPSNLDIIGRKQVAEPARRPNLLRETPTTRVWHKKDDRWWLPRASTIFMFRSPTLDDSATSAVSSRLFAELVNDALQEYSYDADIAGLSYSLSTNHNALLLMFSGFNDKLPVLVRTVVEKMRGFKVDPTRFEIIKEQLQRALENFRLSNPYQHALYLSSHLTVKTHYLPEEQLEALHAISADSLQSYVDAFLKRAHLETLLFGNIVKDDALHLVKQVEEILAPASLPKNTVLTPLCLLLPRGSNHIYRQEVPNPDQLNSAIEHFIYIGDDANQAQRVRLQLLAQIASEPCFDQLRTKEQLGYIVQSGSRGSIGMHGFRIIVQSERDADYVEERIEKWLEQFRQYVVDMSEEDFVKQRQSLYNRKMEDWKNMQQEVDAYWMQIHAGYYDFGRKRVDAAEVVKLSKDDLLAFMDEFIMPSSTKRAKLSVHMRSQRVNEDAKNALRAAYQSAGASPSTELEALLESSPTYAELADFVKKESGDKQAEIVAAVEKLRSPPAPKGAKLIDSIDAFRSSLEVGPPSKPTQEVRDWLARM